MVFFRFRMPLAYYGGPEKLSPAVDIEQEHLVAKPTSLMSVLAQKRWQEGEDKLKGETSEDAIVVDINSSPCRGAWSPNLAEWVPTIYAQQLSGDCVSIAGIPPAVELESAFSVLDYLGLAPADPKDIDMSDSKAIVQIRAKLYLRYMKEMDRAKEYVIKTFLDHPTKEKWFVFMSYEHDLDFIVAENYGGSIPVNQMGLTADATNNFEWVQQDKLRKQFVDELKGEGFKVRFLQRLEFSTEAASKFVEDYTFEGSAAPYTTCHSCGEHGHLSRECPASDARYTLKYCTIPTDTCWAATEKSGKNFDVLIYNKLFVLSVQVPTK